MVRFICVFLILLSLNGLTSQAQQFTFGPKIGYTSSHLTSDQDTLLDQFKQGFEAGLFFRFYNDYLYFQPELMYVTKGGAFDDVNQSLRRDVYLQSIDLPLIFGLKLGPDEFNFRLHAGPVYSYIFQKTIDVSGTGLIDPVTDPIKEQNIKNSYLGAILGIGLDIVSFSIDVRYEYGWDNVYKQSAGDPNLKMRNEMYNVTLGYKIL